MIKPVRPSIMQIKPYSPGLSEIDGQEEVIKLSSNENPLGASPKAKQALQDSVSGLHRYADGACVKLRKTIGELHNIDWRQTLCGAGSDEIIAMLCYAFAGEGDEILYSQHGFLMYPISALRVGAKAIKVPEKSLRTDVEAFVNAVTPKTRLIFIANPNNPTGSYISKEEMRYLCDNVPEDVIIVIDSAYAEYSRSEEYSEGIEEVNAYPNVVMLRTFSKIYGLAAVRLGWVYAQAGIIDILDRVRGPFNVTGSANEAGKAALLDQAFVEKSYTLNQTQGTLLTKSFEAVGLHVYPSAGNFLLVKFPQDKSAQEADAALKQHGIIIRRMEAYGLDDCLRFTIGTEEENQQVMQAVKTFMA